MVRGQFKVVIFVPRLSLVEFTQGLSFAKTLWLFNTKKRACTGLSNTLQILVEKSLKLTNELVALLIVVPAFEEKVCHHFIKDTFMSQVFIVLWVSSSQVPVLESYCFLVVELLQAVL